MLNLPYALLLATSATAATPSADQAALTAEIRAADARLFALVFDECDPKALEAMLAPDYEMYHDKGGLVATSASTFVTDYAQQCKERQAPGSWRSRRELGLDSLVVEPIPGFGAMEFGSHRFFERQGDNPERLAGTALFAQVWQKTADGWKLKRVLSYSHRAAEQ